MKTLMTIAYMEQVQNLLVRFLPARQHAESVNCHLSIEVIQDENYKGDSSVWGMYYKIWVSEKHSEDWLEILVPFTTLAKDIEPMIWSLLNTYKDKLKAKGKLKEPSFTNWYLCPDCGTEWDDTADCMCNDRCPDCNKEITPRYSQENK